MSNDRVAEPFGKFMDALCFPHKTASFAKCPCCGEIRGTNQRFDEWFKNKEEREIASDAMGFYALEDDALICDGCYRAAAIGVAVRFLHRHRSEGVEDAIGVLCDAFGFKYEMRA